MTQSPIPAQIMQLVEEAEQAQGRMDAALYSGHPETQFAYEVAQREYLDRRAQIRSEMAPLGY